MISGNTVNADGDIIGPDRIKVEEDDFFEIEEQDEGTEFMAVKPWVGAVKACEPDTPPVLGKGLTNKNLELE